MLAAISSLTLTPRFLDRVVPPDQTFDLHYCGLFRFALFLFFYLFLFIVPFFLNILFPSFCSARFLSSYHLPSIIDVYTYVYIYRFLFLLLLVLVFLPFRFFCSFMIERKVKKKELRLLRLRVYMCMHNEML